MKESYILAGIKLNRFVLMLFRNKGFSLKYILRVLFLINAGIWSGIFAITERKRFKQQLENATISPEPVFIVGNWRTGTTLLHQLLSLDQNFSTPSVYQVSNPDHMLTSAKYYRPLMNKVLGEKRPMDNVKIGFDEPQEDEYALLKLCKNTPLEDMLFVKPGQSFFLEKHEDFMPKNEAEFVSALKLFMKKLCFQSEKQILLKNPLHSLRLPMLKKHFPDAKFIHIVRNPENVVPSTIHMWNVIGKQNLLKSKWISPTVEFIANFYKKIILTVRNEISSLPSKQKIEIKFEELEKNPIDCIKSIYNTLNISFDIAYEEKLHKFCSGMKSYKKNKYNLSKKDKTIISEIFEEILPEYYHKS